MTDYAIQFILGVNAIVLVYFLLLNGGYLFTTVLAITAVRRHAARASARDVTDILTAGAPPITLLAPAYNEEATCVEATTALLSLVYPDYEVIVINDGSKDGTMKRLTDAFDLESAPRAPTAELPTASVRDVYRSRRRPSLWVVDKQNGGKADALNVGINYCRTELFCAMDADTLLERDALARVVRPFLEDARTVAAGGIIRIVNDSQVHLGMVEQVRLPRRLLPRFQVLEYLRAFLAGRVGWDVINAMLIISGAFGLFRRSLVVRLGGYATDTVGEDMELVVRIHRHCRAERIPYRVTFIPDPVAWTECPESARVLGRQRDRWQRGLMQVLARHRTMLLNPRYGRIGMLAFPYFYFLEGWGPIVELAGYLAFALAMILGLLTPLYVLTFFMVAFVFGAALSVAAIGLEELSFRRYERWRDLFGLMLVAVLEPFGYRQLSTWWRVKGVWSALRGVQSWGAMERRGFRAALLIALLSLPAPLGAQTDRRWSARAGMVREQFESSTPSWSAWEAIEVLVARRLARGSVAVGATRVRRFDIADGAGSLDSYARLWRGGYANARIQLAPEARVIARSDISLELFHGLRGGWEPSLSYRSLRFRDADVAIVAGTMGKYIRDWYGRVRATRAVRAGGTDAGHALAGLIRRYLGSSAELAEISVSVGGEATVLSVAATGQPTVAIRGTSEFALTIQKYVRSHLGLSATLNQSRFEGVPHRTGVSLGLLARW